jgi:ABC-type taurine transport system substrate-binding protein
MDVSRLVRSKPPSPFRDGLIARAARSWNPEFPGRRELPRKYANICQLTMILATSKKRNPKETLHEVCRIKGVDESEVIEALEGLAHRIEKEDCASQEKQGIRAALTSRTKYLLERLR